MVSKANHTWKPSLAMSDLFSGPSGQQNILDHGDGLFQIKGLTSLTEMLPHIEQVAVQSPFRHMMTPMGHATKVAMTNCGQQGWIASEQGYGYRSIDPLTGQPWPTMPEAFYELQQQACRKVDIQHYVPDTCLINRYEIGMSMGRHQDKDEANFDEPIVSVSLGLNAIFQVVGATRSGTGRKFLLEDGDVFILSGPSRLFYHGVSTIKADPLQPSLTRRYNLTFRRAGH